VLIISGAADGSGLDFGIESEIRAQAVDQFEPFVDDFRTDSVTRQYGNFMGHALFLFQPGHTFVVLLLELPDSFRVLQGQADIVETVQQAVFAELVDLEAHLVATGRRHDLPLEIDAEPIIIAAGKFLEQDPAVWDQVMAVNVTAPATLARAAGRILVDQGAGKIINIASTSGILGKAALVAYSSSKGALLQFTKALAAEWGKTGVQVNAIAPGAFETDAQSAVLESPDILKRRLGKIPARRMGRPSTGDSGGLLTSRRPNTVSSTRSSPATKRYTGRSPWLPSAMR